MTTPLVIDGNYYFTNSNGQNVPILFEGSNVNVGQFTPYWVPAGTVQTSTGYEIAWKYFEGSLVATWSCDSSGAVYGFQFYQTSTYAFGALETTFGQDLNGDGVIGPTKTLIATDNGTQLTQVADEYVLSSGGGASAILSCNNSPVIAGQFSGWTPIGAIATASGYEVAWQRTGSDLISIWNTDSSGNNISYKWYLGSDPALEAIETTFQQDLNGDGVIGVPTTTAMSLATTLVTTTSVTPQVISTDLGTSLTQVGNEYFLYNGAGTGPAISQKGVAVTQGEFEGWTPIGAVATSTGYKVAWENAANGLFSIWNTDASGNVTSYKWYLGTDPTLEALEKTFQQDLNGDGTIGKTVKIIQTDGGTSLAEISGEYYLLNSAGNGPALLYQGSPVTEGQFPGWTPIGAISTGSGYEVAWKNAGSDLVSIWDTDTSGNLTSYAQYVGSIYGGDYNLETLESAFGQDLNGDGTVGLTKTVVSSDGTTSLTQVAEYYYLYDNSGAGPALKYGGGPIFGSEFAPWNPVGVLTTSSGYEVTWNYQGTNQYQLWDVDSSGNVGGYTAYTGAATATIDSAAVPCLSMQGALELTSPSTLDVAFSAQTAAYNTLSIDQATSFTGSIYNFAGTDKTTSDAIDLKDVAFSGASINYQSAGKNNGGVLTVYDANNTVVDVLQFANGQFRKADFKLADDGQGGLLITEAPVTALKTGVLQLTSPSSLDVAFSVKAGAYGTLIVDHATSFTGSIYNFAGTSKKSDAIDLKDVAFSGANISYQPTGKNKGGTLTIYDANNTVADVLQFANGRFHQENFKLADDGQGGLLITEAPVTALKTSAALTDSPASATVKTSQDAYSASSLQQFWSNIGADAHSNSAANIGNLDGTSSGSHSDTLLARNH